MMRFLLSRAVNPAISLVEALKTWNSIARSLRESTRKRSYQADRIAGLLC